MYKLVRYVPTEYDRYAEAVALVGDGSFLFGEAVLAMHGLALANPVRHISVANDKKSEKGASRIGPACSPLLWQDGRLATRAFPHKASLRRYWSAVE